MSSHPGGRKTPSCLLTYEHGKREFVYRSKGLERRRGGEGGVSDLMPCYQWRIKNGKLPQSLVMNSYHLDKILVDI